MKWQFTNDAPIYSQLIKQIKAGIVTGEFHSGEKLPSVRDMAMEAGVNPNTLQRAMVELEREGLVYSHRTSGRFVTEDSTVIKQLKRTLAMEHVEKFMLEMHALGFSADEIDELLHQSKEKEEEK